MEIWKITKNYPNYEVSNLGRIRHVGYTKVRNPCSEGRGYLSLHLINKEGKLIHVRIHRLVASTFIGIGDGLVVDHINRIKTDNRLENLRVVTQKENTNNRGVQGINIERINKIIELHKKGLSSEEIFINFEKLCQ